MGNANNVIANNACVICTKGSVRLEIFTDGLCEPKNPGGMAIRGGGSRDGQILDEGKKVIVDDSKTSNNVAEY